MRRRLLQSLLAVTATVLLAPTLHAQETPQPSAPLTPLAMSALAPSLTTPAPALANAAAEATATTPVVGPVAGAVALKAKSSAPVPAPKMQDTNRGNTALIVVGLATIVVGALVDDDAGNILILSGAAIGVYGLWRMLR
jgi:hypothetical protein